MGKHFSFIHCADLHLGEPFGDVRLGGSGPWNEQISKSTFKAFEKVVDAAIDNRVDAILISGDVYNSDHHSLAAQMAFARELYRAAENGIETFIVQVSPVMCSADDICHFRNSIHITHLCMAMKFYTFRWIEILP